MTRPELKDYIIDNPQQIITICENRLGFDSWRRFIDQRGLSKWLIGNFDHFTKNKFKHSPYRHVSIERFRDNPIDTLVLLTDGDATRLSRIVFRFFDIDKMMEEL